MVRVVFGRAEGVEQPAEFLGIVVGQSDREMRPAERREQLEPRLSELTGPGQVDGTVRGEPLKEPVERGRPNVVQRAEHRDSPERLAAEDEGVVGSLRLIDELGERRRPAPNDDDAVVRRAFVPQVRSELLSLGPLGHVAMPHPVSREAAEASRGTSVTQESFMMCEGGMPVASAIRVT